mgnify:CR=1 FL=1
MDSLVPSPTSLKVISLRRPNSCSTFGILEALFHLGPLSQKSLGQKVLSTKGNITTIVDNLEKEIPESELVIKRPGQIISHELRKS